VALLPALHVKENDTMSAARAANDNERQQVEEVADEIADLLGVDPEDIATEPAAGRISLTVAQARLLLAANQPERRPDADLAGELDDALARFRATGEIRGFLAAQSRYSAEETRLRRALYDLTGRYYEPSERYTS